jgi:hypothetical protein
MEGITDDKSRERSPWLFHHYACVPSQVSRVLHGLALCIVVKVDTHIQAAAEVSLESSGLSHQGLLGVVAAVANAMNPPISPIGCELLGMICQQVMDA